jgi:hypothetical protein
MNDRNEATTDWIADELRRGEGAHGGASRDSENRLVALLQGEGLLRPRGRSAPPRTRRGSRAERALVAAALALALFSAGVTTGQWLEGRTTANVVAAALQSNALAQAMEVQQAGSAYVRALARLSEMADAADAGALGAGREAAGVALHAAAIELARLSPDDPAIQEVLNVLDARALSTMDNEGG